MDDAPTVCAISLLAAILANLLHEGLGHAATALLTSIKSGLLTTALMLSYSLRLASVRPQLGRVEGANSDGD
jgi:hypothetical protein